MAINKKYKDILIPLLEIKKEYSIKEFQQYLGIASNWVHRNREELLSLGFIIVSSTRKQRQDSGSTRVGSKLVKAIFEKSLLDFKYYEHLLLKHYINKAYTDFGLIAPFQLEAKEFRKEYVSSEIIDLIDDKIKSETFDYLDILKTIVETSDIKHPFHISNYPINITIFLNTLYNSIPLLQQIKVSEDTLLIINNTFKDLFGFLPTEEQIQVVAKAILYASSPSISYRSVAVQSDGGTSKSCCAIVIQNILRANLNPLIVAKTNKALVGMKNSKTIAKFLYENVGLSVTKDSWEERKLKAFQKQDLIDFVIVDESSQVGELDRIILQTVCKKVLFMGDKLQCKPIHDRQAVDTVFLHTLKYQYRFDNSELKIDGMPFQSLYTKFNKERRKEKLQELFEKIICGYISTEGFYEELLGDYLLKNSYNSSFLPYIDLLNEYSKDNAIIIAYSQSAVDAINSLINNGLKFKVNSKVSLIQNDYINSQYNGYQYRIIEILPDNKFLCRSIETNTEYIFKGAWLTLAYALTTMTSQGSQWDYVLGIDRTCPSSELLRDRYVIITRAVKSVNFLSSKGMGSKEDITTSQETATLIELSEKAILDLYRHSAKEGNRNNLLYGCYKDLIKINAEGSAFKVLYQLAIQSGLEEVEINSIFNLNTKIITLQYLPVNTENRTVKYFTPVFENGKTLIGKDRTLTEEAALSFTDIKYIAEELKGSNRVVIDCDSKETALIFEKYIDKTESYVNSDLSSVHLVFTTSHLIPTKHKPYLDLLGNEKHTLRNIKNNKTCNGNVAIPITQEILDLFNEL